MKASVKELGISRLLCWGGALLMRAGHASFATQLYRVADSLVPTGLPPFAYARALWQDHQYDEAKGTLIKILAHTGEHAEASNLLGVMFFEEDKIELAVHHFERAIATRPNFAAPRNNLGNIHRARHDLEQAERCYRAALECDSGYVEALTNLGVILNLRGDNAAAEDYCRQAIERAPNFAGAHCNLGNVLLSIGRGGEAIAAYRDAIRLQPDLPEALVNLALVLEDSRYLAGTIDYYEQQLKRQPENHLPHVRIAQALQAQKRWEDARQRLGFALELKPEAADALLVLGVNYQYVGDAYASVDCMRRILDNGPHAMAQMGIAFNSLYLEDCPGGKLRALFRDWANQYLIRLRSTPPRPATIQTQTERRLRVGYVSRDFGRHSVAFFLEPIMRHHDRKRMEVFCYSTLIKGDDFTERFKSLADNWRDISIQSEKKAVDLIKEDQIDILVDLSGHTTGNRLGVFACKPAPVQVTYLGHPATTGLAAIDYRIGDAVADPVELTADHYVERLWQLPDCFLTYQPPADAPQVAQPPVLAKGDVTFGSFNNIAKLNDRVIGVWAEILSAVPSSRLLLKGSAFASSHGRARLVDSFSRHGIAQDRLELLDWRADLQNHLELYGEIDIALDPFPYNGTTTTCEALWMGVPVICLAGDRHSGRVGASLLTVLGLGDLLARTRDEYVHIAVELSGNPERLHALREGMRARMRNSVLLDHAGFTDRLEQAYLEMWREYCQSATEGESRAAYPQSVALSDEMIRLHIGGQQTRPGWKVLNIQTGPGVDYLGDIRDLSQFADQSCDEVYASHVLEHVALDHVSVVLKGLFRIMKRGSPLRLSVPDLDALCRLYVNYPDNPEIRLHVMRMIFGGQTDPHDYHQVGFDFEFLKAHLHNAGFERVERVADFNLFLDSSYSVHYGVPISLNVIAYRPSGSSLIAE